MEAIRRLLGGRFEKNNQNRRPPSHLPPPNGNDATANSFSSPRCKRVKRAKKKKKWILFFRVSFSHAGTNCLGPSPKPFALPLFCDPKPTLPNPPAPLISFPLSWQQQENYYRYSLPPEEEEENKRWPWLPFECRSCLGATSTNKKETFNNYFYYAWKQLKKQNFQHVFVESLLTLSQLVEMIVFFFRPPKNEKENLAVWLKAIRQMKFVCNYVCRIPPFMPTLLQ